jgi:RNA polymerase sigma-70 factor (ECF subfamily)
VKQSADEVRALVGRVYQEESHRILATLIRLLGDFDRAEEALHEAFRAALECWPRSGLPGNPRTWLVSTGRFKAIDALRRRARFDAVLASLALEAAGPHELTVGCGDTIEDDRLRMIVACCHPALAPEGRVALTLREVCGLTTNEIASAFLVTPATLAQRIVRAKAKIRDVWAPYQAPALADLRERLAAVLQVVSCVFSEGDTPATGEAPTRPELSAEAIRLGRLLRDLLPEPEVLGLLALMLLHEARRPVGSTAGGDVIPLEEQDRTRWDRHQIAEGLALAERALLAGRPGPYTLQAAIAATHARATSSATTDWPAIVALSTALMHACPSPVVALRRASAVAMVEGPAAGLALIDALLARGELADSHLAYAARADMCLQLGRLDDARAAYARALALARQTPLRRLFVRRLAEVDAAGGLSAEPEAMLR